MDETLYGQPKDFERVVKAPDQIGGFRIGVVSYRADSPFANNYGCNVRIFRSKYRYRFHCHEDISLNVSAEIVNAPILIQHNGYELLDKRVIGKCIRNLTLLGRDWKEKENARTLEYMKMTADMLSDISKETLNDYK